MQLKCNSFLDIINILSLYKGNGLDDPWSLFLPSYLLWLPYISKIAF